MVSEYALKVLVCCECGEEFVLTASAQAYFAQRGYKHPPRRCRSCFIAAKRRERHVRKVLVPAST
jgi:hypothetical protein